MNQMRKVYLDTEFMPMNSSVSGLISVGLVDDSGREFYAVNWNMLESEVRHHPWLGVNVWPHLPKNDKGWLDKNHPAVMGLSDLRAGLEDFWGNEPSETYAWYGAQDLVRIHSLWNNDWEHMPSVIPRWHHELQGLSAELGNPELPVQSSGWHNALEDAKYNRELHTFLLELKG